MKETPSELPERYQIYRRQVDKPYAEVFPGFYIERSIHPDFPDDMAFLKLNGEIIAKVTFEPYDPYEIRVAEEYRDYGDEHDGKA